jgi:hypothetical protein
VASYSYYRTITIDHTKVPSTQTNFPVLISTTLASLKTQGNGGNVVNASGFDIILSTSLSDADKLDFEIESYSATTGAINYWVRISSLSSSVDTVIYLLYGCATVASSQENATGVWDANFYCVYHLKTTSSLVDRNDSTSNARHLSKVNLEPTVASLKIDGSMTATLNARLEKTSFGNPGFPFTISFWLNANNTQSDLIRVNSSGVTNDGWRVSVINSSSVSMPAWIRGGILEYDFSSITFSRTGLVYFVVNVSATGSAKAYVGSGGSVATQTIAASTTVNGTIANLTVGETPGPDFDEIRLSNTDRSADWISTEYANQNSPSTFVTIAAEVANPEVQTFADSISLSDGIQVALGVELSFGDSISVSDALAGTPAVDVAVTTSDQISLTDSAATFLDSSLSFGEQLNLVDDIQVLLSLFVQTGESLSLVDHLGDPFNGVEFEVGDAVYIVDGLLSFLSYLMQMGDSLSLTDSIALGTDLNMTVEDAIALTDAILTQVINIVPLSRSVGDQISLTDAVTISVSTSFSSYIRRYLNDVPNE